MHVPNFAYDILLTGFFSALVLVYVFMVNQYKGVQVPVALLAVASVIMSYVATNTAWTLHLRDWWQP